MSRTSEKMRKTAKTGFALVPGRGCLACHWRFNRLFSEQLDWKNKQTPIRSPGGRFVFIQVSGRLRRSRTGRRVTLPASELWLGIPRKFGKLFLRKEPGELIVSKPPYRPTPSSLLMCVRLSFIFTNHYVSKNRVSAGRILNLRFKRADWLSRAESADRGRMCGWVRCEHSKTFSRPKSKI